MDAVDAEMETEKALIRAATEATYRAALAREASLMERISELKGSVQNLRERRIDYTILQREVDTARTQYEALLQRMKEVSIAGGVGASQVSIVDKALRPGAPFEPNLRRTLLQALILSLAAGIAIALGLNYIDDTIKTPEDVKQKLALAAIGVIPLVRGKKTDNITDALGDPKSPITEAFFSARTALQFTTPSGAPRSLVLTSSRPEEGKTSSSVSLAMSFARSGRHVLIIDADLRKPSFVAPARASVGLSGLLTGDELLENNVIGSGHENLFLLPSGVIPPNPAELLSGARLPALIREATEMFDIVIIDSPPLLGFADAQILSSAAEATLVVIESGSIRRQVAQRALERLQESQGNIIGVILTKFDEKKLGYEAGYYYYAYGKGGYAYAPTRASKKRKIRLFAEGDARDLPPIGHE
jgi:capsular exopolysaccharide synthesis family protein